MSAKISGIAAIHYAVKDMDRASAFWKSLLDIRETSFEFDYAAEWLLRDGTPFIIGTFAGEWTQSSGAQFEVADVAETAQLVDRLGGRITGDVRDFGSCEMLQCEDSEGNAFTLHHKK